jgi:hypothetical protein
MRADRHREAFPDRVANDGLGQDVGEQSASTSAKRWAASAP